MTYDPAEFTPLVLHFVYEFGPSMTERCPSVFHSRAGGDMCLLVLANDKIRVYGIQCCTRVTLNVPVSLQGNETVPLRCTSGPKNSKKDMLLISHVRFFPSLSPKMDWSVLRRASRWPKKLMYLPWATNDQGARGGEEIVAFSLKNPIKRPKRSLGDYS